MIFFILVFLKNIIFYISILLNISLSYWTESLNELLAELLAEHMTNIVQTIDRTYDESLSEPMTNHIRKDKFFLTTLFGASFASGKKCICKIDFYYNKYNERF